MTAPLFEFEETSVDLLTGLCRPRQHQTIALQGIPRPHRHNPEVGIMSFRGIHLSGPGTRCRAYKRPETGQIVVHRTGHAAKSAQMNTPDVVYADVGIN